MRYNVIGYLLSEGFRNVLKNKKSTIASLMIMCATMLIFGLFFLIGENVNHMMEEVKSEQGMQVFMYKEATEDQIQKLEDELKAIDEIETVKHVTKEEALNGLKEKFGDRANLLDVYIENNPLGDSFVVTLYHLENAEEVKEEISQLDNIKEITARDKVVDTLISIANGIRIISLVILILLIVISIFIISNTIKLTVHARRKEISIMKYVGATNGFIRWPFIVEGMIIGVVAAMISILLLGLAYNFVVDKVVSLSISNIAGISVLTFQSIFGLVITVYLGLGIGIGAVGSIISMRKYLEV